MWASVSIPAHPPRQMVDACMRRERSPCALVPEASRERSNGDGWKSAPIHIRSTPVRSRIQRVGVFAPPRSSGARMGAGAASHTSTVWHSHFHDPWLRSARHDRAVAASSGDVPTDSDGDSGPARHGRSRGFRLCPVRSRHHCAGEGWSGVREHVRAIGVHPGSLGVRWLRVGRIPGGRYAGLARHCRPTPYPVLDLASRRGSGSSTNGSKWGRPVCRAPGRRLEPPARDLLLVLEKVELGTVRQRHRYRIEARRACASDVACASDCAGRRECARRERPHPGRGIPPGAVHTRRAAIARQGAQNHHEASRPSAARRTGGTCRLCEEDRRW